MSADVLRRAAALMRDRAEACRSGFEAEVEPDWYTQPEYLANALRHEYGAGSIYEADAEHIAAADPPFMLAVADLLDTAVIYAESLDGLPRYMESKALAVARAYLKDQS